MLSGMKSGTERYLRVMRDEIVFGWWVRGGCVVHWAFRAEHRPELSRREAQKRSSPPQQDSAWN
jgi:hypothetical protein